MGQNFVAFSEYLNFELDDVLLLAKLDKAVLILTKFDMKLFREKKTWKGFGPFVKDIGSK